MVTHPAKDLINSVKKIVETEILAGTNEILCPRKAAGSTENVLTASLTTLELLKNAADKCIRCPLGETRTNCVFGEGNLHAKLMFVGEAPGHDEDIQGRPFVGRAGQLLTQIIESIGLTRGEVYIANVLKCRPPENRNPLPAEIAACLPYLNAQIKLIKPKVVCALGKFAAQTLLNTDVPITRLRGKFYDCDGFKLMPTYHPAYLLRNPDGKRDVWKDMQMIAKELNLRIPQRKARKL